MKLEILFGVQLVYVMCLVSLNLDTSVALPLDHVAGDTPSQQITSTLTDSLMPPLVFPKDPAKFKIQPINETALKFLQHRATLQGNLTNNKDLVTVSEAVDQSAANDKIPRENPGVIATRNSDNPKQDAEDFQSGGSLAEDDIELEERFELKSQDSKMEFIDLTVVDQINLKPVHHALLVAGILGLMCACLYISISTWRYFITQKYGNRERLVNEEDDYIPTSQHQARQPLEL